MASVRFNLRSKKTNPALICGRLYFEGKEYPFGTDYSINPKNWNQKGQRVGPAERNSGYINSYLQELSSRILNIHDELKRDRKLKIENIDKLLKGEVVDKTFFKHIEKVIENIQIAEEKEFQAGKKKRRNMTSRYSMCYKRLQEFALLNKKKEFDYDDITLDFYAKYMEFLKSCNLSVNSIGGEIKRLKRFLNLATIENLTDNKIFKSTEFKAPSEKTKHIYLDEEELDTLFNLELQVFQGKIRDIFMIGCRTGLRVSDYSKCIGDSVNSSGLICIDDTEKTGEPVYVPLHWQVKKILEKYDGVPPLMCDQILNRELKKIGQLAGFTKIVKDTRKGVQKPKGSGSHCEKWELITTHTARRSCATNLYMAGFDLYFIQGILGHTNIKTTINYLGVTRKLMAMKLKDNVYFSESVTEKVTE